MQVQLDRSRRQLRWPSPTPSESAAAAAAAASAAAVSAAAASTAASLAARPASPEVRDTLHYLVGQNRELSSENGLLRNQLEVVSRALSPPRSPRAVSPGRAGRLAWPAAGRDAGFKKAWSPGGGSRSAGKEARSMQYSPKMGCAYGL